MRRRVVITGMGAVSPLGRDVETLWNGIVSCRSGVRLIDTFDTSDIASKIAGMIPLGEGGFNADDYITPSEQRKIDKFIIYAISAASQAISDSGFSSLTDEERSRTAVLVGSGIGGVSRLYDTSVILFSEGARRVTPFFIPSVLSNLASGHIAIRHKITGPNYSIVSACASGTHSIGEGYRFIRDGYIDFAVVGGAEAAVCCLGVAGFAAARALSTHFNDAPELASRPWDRRRDGFIVGEGAGILTLETLDSAKRRNAKVYAEVIGYGSSCDAFHITAPAENGVGAMDAMQGALKDAMINGEEIDYLNAHGTSTPAGDIMEIRAIKSVFKDHASKINVSSTKSAMGHLLGAAGAIEAIISIFAMNNGVAPPTLNLDDPDDECDLNLTPKTPQERQISCIMSNSFGFGGTNACIILRKV
ncbi:MAG: beta-ketoacyl-ACP synthase II [Holosporales bacterium]|nr:beta-ketoacyl-ACP synthase II [Holosporales bacterium]